MMERELPVAVFDSGVGGISVLRELVRLMPGERFVYFGDSANAPYGERPTEEVRELSIGCARTLLDRGAKALVVACNTATSAAISELRRIWPDRIIVGIEPAVKLASERFPGGRILVMATEVTLREKKFQGLLARVSQSCRVDALPCPGLAELVEAGKTEGPEVERFLTELLAPALAADTAAIVLGCTHYPFVKKTVQSLAGPGVAVLDGGRGTARETMRRLEERGLLRYGEGSVEFLSSSPAPEELPLMERLFSLPGEL